MITVGVGECAVSARAEDTLVTYGLGSCIGVTIWDPELKVGGMLHFLLPDSQGDLAKAKEHPGLYADTGIPLLFRKAYQLGADKRRLVVRVAGGAHVLDGEGPLHIGKRNYLAMKKVFWKAGVMIHGREVGGAVSRTMRLEVGSGRVMLQQGGAEAREIEMRHCA